ncbi:MAG: PIG-L family deacetylase [Flavobacteriales bacterium]
MPPFRNPGLRTAFLSFLVSAFSFQVSAQRPPEQPNAAEILHRMQKLQVVGSVLYIVAHPDDENTRLISWLANGKKVRTGNLSLTRGDGGQNLIGPELGDALGIIRTQELMEARRIDGGDQFFTRAVDFGYSKSAEESFEKWGKQEVLSDVVRVIRMFRPDIIITRFPPNREAGHGHHEASAILAAEAFDLAGDPKAFPEQLEQGLEPWQPRRLFWNGSTWWRSDLAEIAAREPDWFAVDVGGYDPLLGLSYTEIAGRSRSMHKSQGFGASQSRGELIEYLHFEKGDRPKGNDIFEGIDMTWNRVKGSERVASMLAEVIASYEAEQPADAIPLLSELRAALDQLNTDGDWQLEWAIRRVNDLLRACTGLTAEYLFPAAYIPDGAQGAEVVVVNRSEASVTVPSWNGQLLKANAEQSSKVQPLGGKPMDAPFWLENPHGTLFDIPSELIGLPVLKQHAFLPLNIAGTDVVAEMPPLYKWVDRVEGERTSPAYAVPVASVIPKSEILIARGGPQNITVEVEALTDDLSGQLNITLPLGWATTKDLKAVNIAKKNDRQSFTFQLIPGEKAQAGAVRFAFVGAKGRSDRTLHEIDHPHIMPQVYYTPAEVKLVPLDVTTTASVVGYVEGAGDAVPQAIERLGVEVRMLDPATTTLDDLRGLDAVVVGIRAYNTVEAMPRFNPLLMRYVEEGGTVVAQYNTRSRDMMLPDSLIGPYPFELTRGRVTVEEAPPTFLDPKHALLNTPNAITTADFEGWVQERGLYFVGDRDPRYTALIAWNDPGEDPLDGALITCEHGKGRYVYTGISFFRELPAGVPGAYRLIANLISPRAAQ